MKKFKLTLGLILCLGFLGSTSMIKQQTSAEIGFALAKAFKLSEAGQVASEAGWGAVGGYLGFEYGAMIGMVGGPVGAVAGAVIGGL
ncbi:MAG: hypothetical protein ACPGRE_09825 [Flavobacteriaceae bacterium]